MKTVVGNWKMNLGIRESVALAHGVLQSLKGREIAPDVVICPPFTALSEVQKAVSKSKLALGAQNCGADRAGAFTGEVSLPMLKDVGCSFVIIGHSERRNYMKEDGILLHKKFRLALEEKITPILCVGETKIEREAGRAIEFVKNQLREIFENQISLKTSRIMVAYEPIWAIGTGAPASVADIVEMHQIIRAEVAKLTGTDPLRVEVLYGGSINDDNAYEYLRESEIDGLLVGGASLKLNQFTGIINLASEILSAQI